MSSDLSNLRVNHGEDDEIVLGIDYLTCRFAGSAPSEHIVNARESEQRKESISRTAVSADTSWPKPPSNVFGYWHK